MVVVVPVPVLVMPPGVLVRVQVPEAGNPLKSTLPVDTPQVGWVIVPIIGAVGVAGWGLTHSGQRRYGDTASGICYRTGIASGGK